MQKKQRSFAGGKLLKQTKKKHNLNLSGDTNSDNTDIPATQTFVVTLVFLHRKI